MEDGEGEVEGMNVNGRMDERKEVEEKVEGNGSGRWIEGNGNNRE